MSLAMVLFSDYRRRVLALLLLHPDRQYYLREIARLTGTVPGTLARELDKLTEAGVLGSMKVGNQRHYFANRDCPIFGELASILRKTSGVVDVLAELLFPLVSQIDVAFVFGSMATDKAHADSDIDVMIVGTIGFNDVVRVLYPAQQTLGREINPKIYSRKEWQKLRKENGVFVKDIMTKPQLFIVGDQTNL